MPNYNVVKYGNIIPKILLDYTVASETYVKGQHVFPIKNL